MDVATGELERIGAQHAVHAVGVRVVHFGSAFGLFIFLRLRNCVVDGKTLSVVQSLV